jgi:hypothetical protein
LFCIPVRLKFHQIVNIASSLKTQQLRENNRLTAGKQAVLKTCTRKKTPPVQGKERKSTLYWQRWQKGRYNRFRQLSVLPMKR